MCNNQNLPSKWSDLTFKHILLKNVDVQEHKDGLAGAMISTLLPTAANQMSLVTQARHDGNGHSPSCALIRGALPLNMASKPIVHCHGFVPVNTNFLQVF